MIGPPTLDATFYQDSLEVIRVNESINPHYSIVESASCRPDRLSSATFLRFGRKYHSRFRPMALSLVKRGRSEATGTSPTVPGTCRCLQYRKERRGSGSLGPRDYEQGNGSGRIEAGHVDGRKHPCAGGLRPATPHVRCRKMASQLWQEC